MWGLTGLARCHHTAQGTGSAFLPALRDTILQTSKRQMLIRLTVHLGHSERLCGAPAWCADISAMRVHAIG